MPRHNDEHRSPEQGPTDPVDPSYPTDQTTDKTTDGTADDTIWHAFLTPPDDTTTDGGGKTFNKLDFDDEAFDDDTPDASTPDADANTAGPQPSELTPRRRRAAHSDRTPKRRSSVRVLTYVVGLAALIGGLVAVVGNHDAKPDPAAAARDDERASRDEFRTQIAPTAEVTVDASPTTTPTPTATPTPPPAVPAPPPSPKKAVPPPVKPKPTTKAATTVAGCAAYTGNQLIACNLLPSFGFSTSEMSALVPMWNNESGWNASAENPGSGAYGIPQALPGNKMASAGSDWRTNPATQIKWGLSYIKDVYGSPSQAWAFWQANGWY